MDSIVHKPF